MHPQTIIEKGQPLKKASKALILLHGRGGTAHDILTLTKQFDLEGFYIAAPEATNNSWYPYSFLEDETLNEPWLTSAIDSIQELVDNIAKHISKDKIYLMGFSQGACLALEVTAGRADKYGGIIAFSGGLIGESLNKNKYSGNYKKTKIFLGVSEQDPHIPLARVKESEQILDGLGADVTLHAYKGASHTIQKEEIFWVQTHIIHS